MAHKLYEIDVATLVPEKVVKSLPYPILVIHGKAATRIPFEHSVRVHRAAQPESSIWLVPEVEHVDAFLTYPDEYIERVMAYYDARLGP